MKQYTLEFMRRGLMASGFGPMVLAVLYLILHRQGLVEVLTVEQVCLGIVSLSALAFVAGGMNIVYQIEQLPIMAAITIHGVVLYLTYLCTYLINDWLERGVMPILVFSGIFLLGYVVIWAVIYTIIKQRTDTLNELLKKRSEEQKQT